MNPQKRYYLFIALSLLFFLIAPVIIFVFSYQECCFSPFLEPMLLNPSFAAGLADLFFGVLILGLIITFSMSLGLFFLKMALVEKGGEGGVVFKKLNKAMDDLVHVGMGVVIFLLSYFGMEQGALRIFGLIMGVIMFVSGVVVGFRGKFFKDQQVCD